MVWLWAKITTGRVAETGKRPGSRGPAICALPDFPEFAQAVRYGVPGTHVARSRRLLSVRSLHRSQGQDAARTQVRSRAVASSLRYPSHGVPRREASGARSLIDCGGKPSLLMTFQDAIAIIR